MTTNPNIQILVTVARDLMDGQQPPPVGPKLDAIGNAVGEIQKRNSTAEFELLGHALLRVLIDRVCGSIKAQETLQKFIRGGDHA